MAAPSSSGAVSGNPEPSGIVSTGTDLPSSTVRSHGEDRHYRAHRDHYVGVLSSSGLGEGTGTDREGELRGGIPPVPPLPEEFLFNNYYGRSRDVVQQQRRDVAKDQQQTGASLWANSDPSTPATPMTEIGMNVPTEEHGRRVTSSIDVRHTSLSRNATPPPTTELPQQKTLSKKWSFSAPAWKLPPGGSASDQGVITPTIDEDERLGDEEIMAYLKRSHARKIANGAKKEDLDEMLKFPEPLLPVPPSSPTAILESNQAAFLSDYEREEILDFPEIYYVGDRSEKKPATRDNLTDNHGYDDERGDYLVVNHDHLAYRYEVIDTLGKGSFGQVLHCRDHCTGQSVAIKIIRNKKRFHHQALVEIKILDNLKKWDYDEKHHVIKMTAHFYFRSHLCIAMELLSINLYELIKANGFVGFTTNLIRRFTSQILASLALMKHHYIIHGDLKPENILLRHPDKSAIKVIDFGSSCLEHEKVYTYIQGRFYRSPEVILGMNYSMAIDMWSLGCILAELYTGFPIFPGENEQEQLSCIMEVLGIPDKELINRASRKKLFFDSTGAPRPVVNSKGRRRRPGTKSLAQVLRCYDESFVDFISKCLIWDPERRLKPGPAMRHPFVLAGRSAPKPLQASKEKKDDMDLSESRISALMGRKRGKPLSSTVPRRAKEPVPMLPMQFTALPRISISGRPSGTEKSGNEKNGGVNSSSGELKAPVTPAKEKKGDKDLGESRILAGVSSTFHGLVDLTGCWTKLDNSGTGRIYKAYMRSHSSATQLIAVKPLRFIQIQQGSAIAEITKRSLQEEAQAWFQLEHCNVAPLLGLAFDEKYPCIVTSWYENGCVRDYLLQDPSVDRSQMVAEAINALEYLHSCEPAVIHGNIKPSNTLIDNQGHLRLSDFRFIGSLQDNDMGLAAASASIESLRWMAPELFPIEQARHTSATDIYALVLLALEIYTGKMPFAHLDQMRLLTAVRHREPLQRSHYSPFDPPEEIWQTLEAGWSPNPDQRPSAVELKNMSSKYLGAKDWRCFFGPIDLTGCWMKLDDSPLTKGGFSDIYRAQLNQGSHPYGNQMVAVKVLRSVRIQRGSATDVLQKRLQREVQVWSKLDHKNILPFLGFAFHGHSPCMVAPWYEHGDLPDYIAKNPNVDRTELVSESIDGLVYLHTRDPPIVHGDLKASNILVDDEGHARITDFGLSRNMQDGLSGFTTSSGSSGTHRWTAPELFNGTTARITTASDIYSLVLLILEVYTQKAPFAHLEDRQFFMAMYTDQSPHRSHYAPFSPPEDIWQVFEKGWSHSSEERPCAESFKNMFVNALAETAWR